MSLIIEQLDRTDAAVVVIPGKELDASNAASLKQDLSPVLEQYTYVVLDLSELTFVDSSGLGAILSFTRTLAMKQGELKLCALQKPVRALVELVRLHRVMDIFNTREEAVRSL